MACILNINYAVIINGLPTQFFCADHGLRQGFSLSRSLFILVMDGLTLQITKVVADGHVQALDMGMNKKISHSLFVDDVLILAMLNRFTWLYSYHIFNKFSIVFGICMNLHKSIVYHDENDLEMIAYINNLFSIGATQMFPGMHYLGYQIKPNCYKNSDWHWLVDCFFK